MRFGRNPRRAGRSLLALALALTVVSFRSAAGEEPPAGQSGDLAERAVAVLRQYCYPCHGREFKVEGYNVLDRKVLIAKRGDDQPYITPGKPEESEIWSRIDEMPPKGPKPSYADKVLLRRWIVDGARFPAAAASRTFLGDPEVLTAIRDHLRSLDRNDRPYYRYFTLAELHNNPKVADEELRLARAGASKLLNSLSRKPTIVVPSMIGPSESVMVVDVRRIGWDNERVWSALLAAYPYGLSFKNHPDAAVRAVAEEIDDLVGPEAGLAAVRVDWFLDTASRPPLYHEILNLPTTAGALESSLHVDPVHDFLRDLLRRAGFPKSGVSKQMRIVDRHDADTGYYWKSYDMRKNGKAVNLFQFPLGPEFAANPFPDQAFTHAGGEIIFSLPNRLQAYMLVNNKGDRIDEGPPEIVFDANDSAGTSTIVNGISCMGCHRNGMLPLPEHLRAGVTVTDEPRRKVERLVPPKAELDALIERDQGQFLGALGAALGPFLSEPGKAAPAPRDWREPVVPVARIYQADLDAHAVAAELNLRDAGVLRALIRANARLQRLGLNDLLKEEGAINRADWATVGRGTSRYQQVSAEIERATPVVFFRKEP
jgi:serine/threonine-protein kinase